MKSKLYVEDKKRYPRGGMPKFQKYYRAYQSSSIFILKLYYRFMLEYYSDKYKVEFPRTVKIGGGLYIGHPYGITINPKVVIGNNFHIRKRQADNHIV